VSVRFGGDSNRALNSEKPTTPAGAMGSEESGNLLPVVNPWNAHAQCCSDSNTDRAREQTDGTCNPFLEARRAKPGFLTILKE
jgi:hypothetical protein